jgi:hypothetical protein
MVIATNTQCHALFRKEIELMRRGELLGHSLTQKIEELGKVCFAGS